MTDSWVYMIGADVLQAGEEDQPVLYNIIELQRGYYAVACCLGCSQKQCMWLDKMTNVIQFIPCKICILLTSLYGDSFSFCLWFVFQFEWILFAVCVSIWKHLIKRRQPRVFTCVVEQLELRLGAGLCACAFALARSVWIFLFLHEVSAHDSVLPCWWSYSIWTYKTDSPS